MKKLSLIFLFSTGLFAQSWFDTVTNGNSLTCTLTNFQGTPAFYSVYLTQTGGVKRINYPTVPIPYSIILTNQPAGIYSLFMTATSTNGVELLPSTNKYVNWVVPPIIPGAPVGLTTK